MYNKQEGICKTCQKHYALCEMDADHIIPWSDGGITIENGQMLCKLCNRKKGKK